MKLKLIKKKEGDFKMKKQYSIIISGSDFSHWWGDVDTLKEAKKLASEISQIGCFWLEDAKISSDDIIHNRVTIDVYRGDDVVYSKQLIKRFRKELLEQGIKKGWYYKSNLEEFKFYNSKKQKGDLR
jgi:hypothetical protein